MKWEKVKLNSLIAEVSKKDKLSDYPVYSVTNEVGFMPSEEYFSKQVFSKNLESYKLVDSGDFAYNPSRINVGSIDYLRESRTIKVSPLYIIFRCGDKINQGYLKYYLKSPIGNAMINNNTSGSVRDSLKFSGLCNIEIPLPPLPIQKRIAEILDEANALRKKDAALLQKYDELLQSIFYDMFGDPIKNEKGWEVKKLGELCSMRRGASPRPIKKFIGEDTAWVKIGDATKGDDIFIKKTAVKIKKEGESKSVLLEPGSLVFANCGVSLGFARILAIRGCIHDGWLSFESLNGKYIKDIFLLKLINNITYYLRSLAPEGTQPNLNTGIMKNLDVICPPIQLQENFAKIVNNINTQKHTILTQQQQGEALFQSLMQRAFKGELVG